MDGLLDGVVIVFVTHLSLELMVYGYNQKITSNQIRIFLLFFSNQPILIDRIKITNLKFIF